MKGIKSLNHSKLLRLHRQVGREVYLAKDGQVEMILNFFLAVSVPALFDSTAILLVMRNTDNKINTYAYIANVYFRL